MRRIETRVYSPRNTRVERTALTVSEKEGDADELSGHELHVQLVSGLEMAEDAENPPRLEVPEVHRARFVEALDGIVGATVEEWARVFTMLHAFVGPPEDSWEIVWEDAVEALGGIGGQRVFEKEPFDWRTEPNAVVWLEVRG